MQPRSRVLAAVTIVSAVSLCALILSTWDVLTTSEDPSTTKGVSDASGRTQGTKHAPQPPRQPTPQRTRPASDLARLPPEIIRLVDRIPPGAPVLEWEDDVPEPFDPASFPSAMAAVLATCDSDFVELGTDCEEPPCTVAVVGNFAAARCADWRRTFGDYGTSDAGVDVDCGGRTARIAVVAPFPGTELSVDPALRSEVKWRLIRQLARYSKAEVCAAEASP